MDKIAWWKLKLQSRQYLRSLYKNINITFTHYSISWIVVLSLWHTSLKTYMLIYSKGTEMAQSKSSRLLAAFPLPLSQIQESELSHLRGAVTHHTILILGSILSICRGDTTHTEETNICCSCCTKLAQGHSSSLSPGTWDRQGGRGEGEEVREGAKTGREEE